MKEIFNIIPVILYFILGVVCLIMAFKCFLSDKYLPFHEKAAGKLWDEIENPLKSVILSFLRLSGLGFLITAILLLVFPIVNFIYPNIFIKYSIPVLALIFCTGLFINNYRLFKKTGTITPWKGSLYAMGIIIVGIIMAFFR